MPPRFPSAAPACCMGPSATCCRTTTARPPTSTAPAQGWTIRAPAPSTVIGKTAGACGTRCAGRRDPGGLRRLGPHGGHFARLGKLARRLPGDGDCRPAEARRSGGGVPFRPGRQGRGGNRTVARIGVLDKYRNPNIEIRNKSEIGNRFKIRMIKARDVLNFLILSFEFVSDFDIRISDFLFPLPCH